MPSASFPERLSAKLVRIFFVLVLIFLALSCFAPVMDNVDLGWHVAQGRWMVQHLAFYRQDAFNYPNLGHAVIDEYPLFQLVLYAAWSLGWWGPCLLTALFYLTLAAVLIAAARRLDSVLSMTFVIATSLMLLCFQAGPILRPHMVTYLAIVVFGVFLLRHREARHWTEFWPLALLQVAWTNCHSGFVMGPAMVGLFGAETVLRRGITDRAFPRPAARTWFAAFALVLLACFMNPYGIARFYPPFVQEHLESIRAYVGEMEPLPSGFAFMYGALFALSFLVATTGKERGLWPRFHLTFLLLAVFFFWEALSAKKAWPVFGLFGPLIVLSSALHGPTQTIERGRMTRAQVLTLNFIFASFLGMGLLVKYAQDKTGWRDLSHGRSELSLAAVPWMQAHHVTGRFFHRCEDGGWLQQSGYDHGETFSDTGFGKFDEAFIHETGLVNERPRLLPKFLGVYRPDAVVCSNWCYQWPAYLKAQGWRVVFYSPNSSVWVPVAARPDLPTVSDGAIVTAFRDDLAFNGLPFEIALLGRNILALNSLGLDDFAYSELHGLPPEQHKDAWYWEAARILCFDNPPSAHRYDFELEAEQLGDAARTAEFRGYFAYYVLHDSAKARGTLLQSARDKYGQYQFGNWTAELLARIELESNDPAALALARRTDCWDLRNGRHWMYLAEAEERWGSLEAARVAWRKAVFYYPDDDELMKAAADFAARHDDAELTQAIADSGKVYGISK